MDKENLHEQIARLSPEKQALLQRILEKKQSKGKEGIEIKKFSPDKIPTSFAQKQIWLLQQMQVEIPIYNYHQIFCVEGDFRVAAWKKTIEEMEKRHEVFRTNFREEEDDLYQKVSTPGKVHWQESNFQEKKKDELQIVLEEKINSPFDLFQDSLLRAEIFQTGTESFVLLLITHQIVFDGWSHEIFLEELSDLYSFYTQEKECPLSPLPAQYQDFVYWEREALKNLSIEKEISFWKKNLESAPEMSFFPLDFPRPSQRNFQGKVYYFSLPAKTWAKLTRLSQELRVTNFSSLLASVYTLLYRLTGQTDLVIGSPVANRQQPEWEKLIGIFLNTLAFRSPVFPELSFREFLKLVEKRVEETLENQNLPFQKLLAEIPFLRNPSYSPFFQMALAWQSFPSKGSLKLGQLQVQEWVISQTVTPFDIILSLMEVDGVCQGYWQYRTDLFTEESIISFHRHWEKLLDTLFLNPEKTLSSLPQITKPQITKRGKTHLSREDAPKPSATQFPQSDYLNKDYIQDIVSLHWKELLSVQSLDEKDNFFALGGHSLLATRIVSRLNKTLGVHLSLADIFEYPTVKELTDRVREKQNHIQSSSPVPPPGEDSPVPLSSAQKRLWFLMQLEPENCSYNLSYSFHIKGHLDVSSLKEAFSILVSRHSVLRTHFLAEKGIPFQFVSSSFEVNWQEKDLRSSSEGTDLETQLCQLASDDFSIPFSLAKSPPWRCVLIQVTEEDWALLLSMHHIITDGWSNEILLEEISHVYNALKKQQTHSLPPLEAQFSDFCRENEKREFSFSEKFWQNQFSGDIPILYLPTDSPRPKKQTYQGNLHYNTLPGTVEEKIFQFSQKHESTTFLTLLSAFSVFLSRLSNQTDFVVGIPATNRSDPKFEKVMGFFVNTLALRVQLASQKTFLSLLNKIKQNFLAAHEHQSYPFERLVELVNPQRDNAVPPLSQVIFSYQNFSLPHLDLEELETKRIPHKQHTSRFDLSVFAFHQDKKLKIIFEYNLDIFHPATIQIWQESFQLLLEGIVENPQRNWLDYELFPEKDFIQSFCYPSNPLPKEKRSYSSLEKLYYHRLKETPSKTAFFSSDKKIDYQTIDEQSNQLAHYLKYFDVQWETPVAVYLERSELAVIAMWAIWKRGGVFIPLDIYSPPERIAFILKDTQASVLISEGYLQGKLPDVDFSIINLDDLEEICLDYPKNDIFVDKPLSSLTYIMYTSGSTGHPKGVMGTQESILSRLQWMWREYPFTSEEVACHRTSLNFIDALWELLGAFLQGIPTLILSEKEVKDPTLLVDLLSQFQVSRVWLVPSHLQTILESQKKLSSRLNKLKLWITTGESTSLTLAHLFQEKLPQATLLNLYGTSEVWDVCAHEFNQSSPFCFPIGRPLNYREIFLFDANLHLVPRGSVGEIFVAGAGLSRGYKGDPVLTAERFRPHPFAQTPGERIYQTGDLARFLPDGNIQYLHRNDHQVKIRGLRISLEEIETALLTHPQVKRVAVVSTEGKGRDKGLIAYIQSSPGITLNTKNFPSFLRELLPAAMIPGNFVQLASLPLTINGKLDRRFLSQVDHKALPSFPEKKIPQDPLQYILRSIWKQFLPQANINIKDSFFDLGGHSLLAVQVLDEINNRCQTKLPLSALMTHGTIEELAQEIISHDIEKFSSPITLVQKGKGGKNFFFFHGDYNGGGYYCLRLKSYIPDKFDFYVLQPHGLGGEEIPLSIEEMALDYAQKIQAIQPQGPYYFGGFCHGGYLAYEITKFFEKRGEKIEILLIGHSWVNNMQFYWLERVTKIWAYLTGQTPEQRQLLFLKIRNGITTRKLSEKERKKSHYFLKIISPKSMKNIAERHSFFDKTYIRVAHTYIPQGKIASPVILFWPEKRLFEIENSPYPLTGWKKLADQVQLEVIPGDHLSCITQYGEEFFRKINSFLERSLEKDS